MYVLELNFSIRRLQLLGSSCILYFPKVLMSVSFMVSFVIYLSSTLLTMAVWMRMMSSAHIIFFMIIINY